MNDKKLYRPFGNLVSGDIINLGLLWPYSSAQNILLFYRIVRTKWQNERLTNLLREDFDVKDKRRNKKLG